MGRGVAAAIAAAALAGSLPEAADAFSGGTGYGSQLARTQHGNRAAASRGRARAFALRMADTMPKKKVVVTGIGAVTPIGTGADTFFDNLMKGEHGFGPLPEWADEFPCKTGAQIEDFKAADWYENKKEAKRQSRYMHLGIAASKLGLKDAKLEPEAIADKSRFGVLIGSAIGGSEYYEEASNKWGKHSEYDTLKSGAEWGDDIFAGRNSIYKGPMFCNDSKFTFSVRSLPAQPAALPALELESAWHHVLNSLF